MLYKHNEGGLNLLWNHLKHVHGVPGAKLIGYIRTGQGVGVVQTTQAMYLLESHIRTTAARIRTEFLK